MRLNFRNLSELYKEANKILKIKINKTDSNLSKIQPKKTMELPASVVKRMVKELINFRVKQISERKGK